MGISALENAVALLPLAVLEIILGIDNLVFISILAGRQTRAAEGSPSAAASQSRSRNVVLAA
jgi:hypothetical protein